MAKINTPIPSLKLNDGTSIPMLGYGTGTAWFKRGDEATIDRTLVESVKTAIGLGYYHLDGAEVYKTEPELGLAIKESGVDRSKLFITTKVMQNAGDPVAALKTSLKKLQVDYVDLYLIHAPYFASNDPKDPTNNDPAKLQKAWAAMEQLKEAGLAKSIGVSNYLIPDLESTLKTAKVVPSINQIEFHPYLQHGDLLAFQKKHGIATAAYGPLTAVTKAKPGPLDETYSALAKKYAVSEGEIALRWTIDSDIVTITTSSKEQRLSDYLRVTTFKLTPKEVEEIGTVGLQKHFRGFWKDKFNDDNKL
ncbi:aldo-keto reductase family 1 member C13 [Venturia nashicola]|uniref:Aldo-keto reductase family 1 member C13 n=1 Tax=Venturia nashicola TaxID=86259 RepID=A0A4Z1NVR8_9PEZI|nr:aldo-keto reductase family 1 member C13 [Venturia nashicola]